MDHTRDPDLIKVTEIFLIPSSFIVAALGTADTNLHRAIVSTVGLTISALWLACSREAISDPSPSESKSGGWNRSRRSRILCWLPIIFVIGWLISMVGHALIWNRPLGSNVFAAAQRGSPWVAIETHVQSPSGIEAASSIEL